MKTIPNYDCKIFTDNIEQSAIDQLNNLLSIPVFANTKIRIMPDVHAGAGCVIGFTAPMGDKVIPNIVGVDIGCGMHVVELPSCPDFEKLSNIIEEYIPYGRNVHEGNYFGGVDDYIASIYRNVKSLVKQLYCFRYLKDSQRLVMSIGSLGGGNHFIEVDKDDTEKFYLVIHSGSRNLGKQVADYYQKLAIKNHQGWDKVREEQNRIIEQYKQEGRRSEIQEAIAQLHRDFKAKGLDISSELCWLDGQDAQDYYHDMYICQEFANYNRITMAYTICTKLGFDYHLLEKFITIHNYINPEDGITRKGAISCKQGEKVIIPINMRDGSIIGFGKGNEDWNCSGPHGAGRIMSRNEAFDKLKLEDFQASMKGIYSTTINESTIDEAPMVYKPIDEIINNIKDTIDIVSIIKPVFNFKASEMSYKK